MANPTMHKILTNFADESKKGGVLKPHPLIAPPQWAIWGSKGARPLNWGGVRVIHTCLIYPPQGWSLRQYWMPTF